MTHPVLQYHYNDILISQTDLASHLVDLLRSYKTLYLVGQVGAGKTTLVREIAAQLGVTEPVMSPTYAYVHRYVLPDGTRLYHFDLYRITSGHDLIALGLDDLLHDPNALNIIEWPERVPPALLPVPRVLVTIYHPESDPAGVRKITIVI